MDDLDWINDIVGEVGDLTEKLSSIPEFKGTKTCVILLPKGTTKETLDTIIGVVKFKGWPNYRRILNVKKYTDENDDSFISLDNESGDRRAVYGHGEKIYTHFIGKRFMANDVVIDLRGK